MSHSTPKSAKRIPKRMTGLTLDVAAALLTGCLLGQALEDDEAAQLGAA